LHLQIFQDCTLCFFMIRRRSFDVEDSRMNEFSHANAGPFILAARGDAAVCTNEQDQMSGKLLDADGISPAGLREPTGRLPEW
jgi:hypothetical protein